MPIKDDERCPAYSIELKSDLRKHVIVAADVLDLVDAWWIGVEDSIFGSLWDEIDEELGRFTLAIFTELAKGTLEDTLDFLGNELIDKIVAIRQRQELCQQKKTLGELITENVLGHGGGKRRFKVVYSRN